MNYAPTFSLSNIDFEGPLSLILQLLSKNKLEIRDVSIAAILEQYIAYLDEMQTLDLEIAGEFVAMAAHLTYLKAKAMLQEEADISELEQLLSSLEALKQRDGYGAIKTVAERIGGRLSFDTFARQQEQITPDRTWKWAIDPAELYNMHITERTDYTLIPIEDSNEERLSKAMPHQIAFAVDRKIEEISAFAVGKPPWSMQDVLRLCRSVTEIVAAFLALLQLVREGRLMITDDGNLAIVNEVKK